MYTKMGLEYCQRFGKWVWSKYTAYERLYCRMFDVLGI